MKSPAKASPVSQSMFAEALRHHQAGRAIEAEQLYRRILQDDPRHAEALHMYGVLYLQVGRPDIALTMIGKAIDQDGKVALFHSHLGAALRLQGKPEAAITAYRHALALDSTLAEAHYNLGNAFQDQGAFDRAAACYKAALICKPDYAEAHFNLGNARHVQGKLDEALTVFGRALAGQPDDADAHYDRGNTLQEQGRLEEALAAYQRALISSPALAGAYSNRGHTLKDLGHFAGAEASYRRAIDLVPGNAKFHHGLAEIKRFDDAGDTQLVMMETQLAAIADLPADAQSHLLFALGKAYDDLGERERSFGHLLAGNSRKRGLIRYDEAATLALFERIQVTFTAELLERKSITAPPGDGPIFIVGMPRSGTSLIEQILASHGQVFGAGELPLFERTTTAFAGKGAFPEIAADLSADDLHRLGAHYRAALRRRIPAVTRITDKLPQNFLYCGLIHLALPNARIIHARRDPIDTCLSCFSKLFTLGHPYSYDLAELGRYYRHYASLMAHWRQVLPAGIMLEVAYEDMVGDVEGQTRRILDHCGLDWDEACLSFDKTERPVRTASATQVRQPIYTSSVGRWRPDGALLKPLIDELEGRCKRP